MTAPFGSDPRASLRSTKIDRTVNAPRRGADVRPLAVLAFAALATPTASAETLPPGGTVAKALTVDVTPSGLDFVVDQAMSMLPAQIAMPDMSGTESCFFSTLNYAVYQGDPSNGVHVDVTSATVSPNDGYFDLSISATIVGTGTDVTGGGSEQVRCVSRVEYWGCGTSCNQPNGKWAVLRLEPTPFAVTTQLYLSLVTDPETGEPTLHATTPLDRDDISLTLQGLDAAGCTSIDLIIAAVKGLIVDQVKDQIIAKVNEEVLPAIEEAFASLRYDDVVAVGASSMHVKIVPSALDIEPEGMALSMSSMMAPEEKTTCVPIAPDAGSRFTPGEPPYFGLTSPGGNEFHLAAAIADDFVNQALFSAWYAGMLCQEVSEVGGSPLSTDLLALAGLSGPLWKLGVEDGAPMLIVIKGYESPEAAFGGEHLIDVAVRRLEVSIFAEVQERMARLVALDLSIDAGVNLVVDEASQLTVAMELGEEDVAGEVAYGEPLGSEADTLLGFLPVMMGQLLPQLSEGLAPIDLSNLGGVALLDPEFVAIQGAGGVPNDTLGFYTAFGAAAGGCEAGGTGGCGVGGGTGEGCAVGGHRGVPGLALLAVVPAIWISRRRTRAA